MRSALTYVRARTRARLEIIRLRRLAGRRLVASAVLGYVVVGLAPVGFVVATSVMIGHLPAAIGADWNSPGGRAVMWAIVAAGGFLALQQGLSPLLDVLGTRISRRIDGHIRDRLAAAAVASPSVALLEDQELLALLSAAGDGLDANRWTPGGAFAGLLELVSRYVPVIAATAVAAIAFSPFWSCALLVGALLLRHGTRRGPAVDNLIRRATIANTREADYFRGLPLEPSVGKDLRMFDLVAWTQRRYRVAQERSWATGWPMRRRVGANELGRYAVVATVFAVAMLVALGDAAAAGDVSLRDAVLVLQTTIIVFQVIGGYSSLNDQAVEYGMGAYDALQSFERGAAGRDVAISSGDRGADGLPRTAIRFHGVSFAYPGSDRPVLDGLDLEIPAGKSLAIVGLNGAGKTTLIKVLARLYEPTGGQITVDGVDIGELSLASWRAGIAAIFQDFVRYELSAADNISLGAVGRRGDAAAIRRAAEQAGALAFLDELPSGLETPLSSRYAGGSDLSGGQWQRVALARALFALDSGASVLVLDEPTASLDVRAEAEIFDRFIDLTAGATTILISHRFSTVRRADRIAVLEHGRVVEQGTHDGLLARRGRYEQLFRLQAARFALGDDVLDDVVEGEPA